MNGLKYLKSQLRLGVSVGLAVVIAYAISVSPALGEGDKATDAKTTDSQSQTKPAAKPEKKPSKPLTGAELYSVHCNRCHPERYPTEWRATEWKTVMTHMRVRANLPAAQAKAILKYLQEESGN